jgi:hypothetical protein
VSETELSKSIRIALEQSGFWVIRLQSSGRHGARTFATGEPGLPDLYLPGLGHLEVKTPTGKLSEEQTAWHHRALKSGVRVGTVRSVSQAVDVARTWREAARKVAK